MPFSKEDAYVAGVPSALTVTSVFFPPFSTTASYDTSGL